MSIEDQSSSPGEQDEYVLVHTGFMGSRKLCSLDGR
jgi:hypothetical protein